MKNIIFTISIVLVSLKLSAKDYNADHYQISRIPTKSGLKIFFQGGYHHFSVEIADPVDSSDPRFIRINKKYILSYAAVPMPQYINFMALSEENTTTEFISLQGIRDGLGAGQHT